MKGLFYCQYVVGIGHLSRSLSVCKSLAQHFDITFLQGGKEMNRTVESPRFHKVVLPPLSAHEHDAVLFDPLGLNSVNEVFHSRRKLLQSILKEKFDFLITEFFPFGRQGFKNEILEIIQQAKKTNPNCKVICSTREVIVKGPHNPENQTVSLLHQYYDCIFVHSDPHILSLEATFDKTPEIQQMLIYTGYVAESSSFKPTERQKRIVISMGSYQIGEEFVRHLISTAPHFSDYTFLFIMGPNTSPAIRRKLEESSKTIKNVQSSPLVNNFQEILCQSSLCFSLGGYNTLVDLVQTKTPGIVYCYERGRNKEQFIRAEKFAEKHLVRLVSANDLTAHNLQKIISEALAAPYPKTTIDLEGADNTAEALMRLLKNNKTKHL